jgi:glucose-6-phosphate 1-dehydrogenase
LHPEGGPLPVHGYTAGSAGPKESDELLKADGRAWRPLVAADHSQKTDHDDKN